MNDYEKFEECMAKAFFDSTDIILKEGVIKKPNKKDIKQKLKRISSNALIRLDTEGMNFFHRIYYLKRDKKNNPFMHILKSFDEIENLEEIMKTEFKNTKKHLKKNDELEAISSYTKYQKAGFNLVSNLVVSMFDEFYWGKQENVYYKKLKNAFKIKIPY